MDNSRVFIVCAAIMVASAAVVGVNATREQSKARLATLELERVKAVKTTVTVEEFIGMYRVKSTVTVTEPVRK